jgi:hypothetical protein
MRVTLILFQSENLLILKIDDFSQHQLINATHNNNSTMPLTTSIQQCHSQPQSRNATPIAYDI